MSDDVFQHAYARVRSRQPDEAWFAMSQREITAAIYAEIRAIDHSRYMSSKGDQVATMAMAAE